MRVLPLFLVVHRGSAALAVLLLCVEGVQQQQRKGRAAAARSLPHSSPPSSWNRYCLNQCSSPPILSLGSRVLVMSRGG